MGENLLGNIMKRMCEATGIHGKKTNHSVRKTSISNLLHAGVAPTLIQQLSGHKNIASISNYATASDEQQKHMAEILMKTPNELAVHALTTSQQTASLITNSNTSSLGTTTNTSSLGTNSNTSVNSTNLQASGGFMFSNINGCTFNFYQGPKPMQE